MHTSPGRRKGRPAARRPARSAQRTHRMPNNECGTALYDEYPPIAMQDVVARLLNGRGGVAAQSFLEAGMCPVCVLRFIAVGALDEIAFALPNDEIVAWVESALGDVPDIHEKIMLAETKCCVAW